MRLVLAAAALALLSGCAAAGSNFQASPVSSGSGPNALKRTPCACAEQPQPAGLPAFLIEANA